MTPLDLRLARLHARALLAIARADHEITPEEGLRLRQRIDARSSHPISIDDLVLDDALDAGELSAHFVSASPFRDGGVHPGELAALIVTDSLAVILTKGHLVAAEVRELLALAEALGCHLPEVERIAGPLAKHLRVPDTEE